MSSNTKDAASTLPELDIKSIISTYGKQWKWFALSCIATLFLAYLYIRYATPQYEATAKIQILEDTNTSNELSAFADLAMMGGVKNVVEDEIEILNSRSNFIEVVKNLGLNTKITVLGKIKDSEVYKNVPIILNFIENDSVIHKANFEFFVELSSNSSYGLSSEEDSPVKVHAFGKKVLTDIGKLIITPNFPYIDRYKGQKLKISISPVHEVAKAYQMAAIITPAQELSNIINISLNSPVKEKGIDIINELVAVYNNNAIEDKKAIADKTSNFINNRIQAIYGDLASVDQDAQELLTEKGMTGSGLEVGAAVQVSAASRQNLENAKVQLQMVSGMKDYVSQEAGYEAMPVVDVGNAAIAETTAKYNELVAERKRLLKSADERNPMIVNLDQQLEDLKSTLQSSLTAMERNVGMNVSTLQNQMGRIQGTIYSAPKNQRELRNITRQQQTTESLYLYLLQKREEAQITAASSPEKSKIIDRAYASNNPVSPKKPIIFLASLILGLLIPFSLIYSKELLDTKVHNMHTLEGITKEIPVLGELPKLSKKDLKLVVKDDRSVLAEALRILRTNLDYLIKTNRSEEGKNNVIYITSSVPGEGKTFISTNLSMILASTNKKVLLIGGDIRNPKLYSFFTGDNIDQMKRPKRNKDAGLTEYIYNDTLELIDIVHPMLVHHNTIDVIYSGRIPPNPSELLMSDRVKSLLTEASTKYDYVIVDTAPLMVVSDTLLISEYANHIIYVTRAGVTDRKAVEFPLKLQEEGKIKGLSFVVNDVNTDNLGYGGKYGYGYGKRQKKWWKF